MSDNNEKITVEVDGSRAGDEFDRLKDKARGADEAIDHLGDSSKKVGGSLGGLADAAKRAADALTSADSPAERARKSIRDLGDEAKKTSLSFDELQKKVFGGVQGGAKMIWDYFRDGVSSAISFSNSFIDKISEIQRTISLMSTIPGGDVGNEFRFLIDLANKFGLSLRSIQTDYAKMQLAGHEAGMTNDAVQRSFEQVSIAVRALHMNQQQAQFTFLALEQMLSKGQVSLEEFRRQFAQRIPGAMQATARELGVTTPQLLEFIQKIGAASEKLLPFITNAVQRLYQDALPNAVRALDAERNRIETSVTMFFKKVLDEGGAQGMADLLKTINNLLQTDEVAKVFANAMNNITTSIANFLRTLKPEDIEKFAKEAMKFFTEMAKAAMILANAIVYLAKNLPMVAAIGGALAGAALGLPAGPIGAAIGAAVGGGAGAYLGNKMRGDIGVITKYDEMAGRIDSLDKQIAAKQNLMVGAPDSRNNQLLKAEILKLQQLRAPLEMEMALKMNSDNNDSYDPLNLPFLKDPLAQYTGNDPNGYLRKLIGGSKDKQAEKLQKQQHTFLENLLGRYQSTINPDEDKYALMRNRMKELGIKDDATATDAYGRKYQAGFMLDQLQAKYNQDKQIKNEEALDRARTQFDNLRTQVDADKEKFKESFNIENLLEVDESAWENKAQKMKSQLTKTITELGSEWTRRMATSPMFKEYMGGEDGMRKQLEDLRVLGDAYIEEFRRIEREKKTVAGGTKMFLKEWNDQVTNFGQISADFLRGITTNIVDMLTNMVMTGRFSFAELTKFVLAYIAKMLIVQAITPFINLAAGAISNGIGALLNVGANIGNSTYSLSSGNSGLGLKLPGRASGGPVWPGQSFMVGERGPEIVSFDRPGYVHPNESLRVGGGDNINITVNVDANGNSSNNQQNGSELGRRIASAVRAVIVDEKRPGGMLA